MDERVNIAFVGCAITRVMGANEDFPAECVCNAIVGEKWVADVRVCSFKRIHNHAHMLEHFIGFKCENLWWVGKRLTACSIESICYGWVAQVDDMSKQSNCGWMSHTHYGNIGARMCCVCILNAVDGSWVCDETETHGQSIHSIVYVFRIFFKTHNLIYLYCVTQGRSKLVNIRLCLDEQCNWMV